MDFKKNEEVIMGILKRFMTNDYYSAKGSASSIIPFIYPRNYLLIRTW